MNKISFIANRTWLDKNSPSKPEATLKEIPEWYRHGDRFFKTSEGEYASAPDGGKVPTWKSCPAMFDMFISGYVLKTPCDIEFYLNDMGKIDVKVKNMLMQDFCTVRPPMHQFAHPKGYYEDHFAWFPDWAIKLPDGYSALYTTPLNRFDLPFLMTSGIIDNDKVNLPGSMPFFLVDGFTGVVPEGTPYAQIIPFKREDWESEFLTRTQEQIMHDNIENSKMYRIPDGGVYKDKVWSRRKYE